MFFEIQEKERQRIARDLHDSSLQNLTHLIHKVELSSLYIDRDPVKAKLDAYYLQHYGLWIDIRCFFGTILSVLKSDGVVEGGTGKLNNNNNLDK